MKRAIYPIFALLILCGVTFADDAQRLKDIAAELIEIAERITEPPPPPDNTPPKIESVAITSPVKVGEQAELSAAVNDPDNGDAHTATIQWGDGATTETSDLANGGLLETHTYQAAGTYTVRLSVVDSDGAAAAATTTITVETNEPPPPPPEGVYPLVTASGKTWTFRTPPPENLKVKESHPRFLINGREDEIRRRMDAPAYSKWRTVAEGRSPIIFKALRYALYGDQAAGQEAKASLLALVPEPQPQNAARGYYWQLCMMDWTYDLFTPAERLQMFEIFVKRFRMDMPPESGPYDVGVPIWTEWISNDSFLMGRVPQSTLPVFLMLLFYGDDAVRPEWCEHGWEQCRHPTRGRWAAPYNEVTGGLLDAWNQRALHSGGIQSGYTDGQVMDGYEGYFSESLSHYIYAWNSATGDDLWSDNQYSRMMPHRLAYRWHKGNSLGGARVTQGWYASLGAYASIDPEMAGLGRWLVETSGNNGNYEEMLVFLMGDVELQPIHPKDIPRMKLGKFLDGDDLCHSRSSWEPDATLVQMFSRSIDSHRYEPPVGALYIVRNGIEMFTRGNGRKGSLASCWLANVRIWAKQFSMPVDEQSDIYWSGSHLRGPHARKPWVDRYGGPFANATNQSRRGILPTEDHGDDSYHVFTVDSSDFQIEMTTNDWSRNLQRADVDKSKRTIVHLRPNENGREFVIVYDRLQVADYLNHCWQARVRWEPEITGNKFTVINDGQQMCGTVLTPGMVVRKDGGHTGTPEQLAAFNATIKAAEDVLEDKNSTPEQRAAAQQTIDETTAEKVVLFRLNAQPDGTVWPTGPHNVFSGDSLLGSTDAKKFGAFAIYIEPTEVKPQQTYCVVLEVGPEGFAPAAASTSSVIGGEQIVNVDGWQVDFRVEDETKVSR